MKNKFPAILVAEHQINLFVTVLAVILGLTYGLARLGFDHNSWGAILAVLGLSFFLIYWPDIGRMIAQKLKYDRIFVAYPALLFYGLVFLIIFGLLTIFFNPGLILILLGFIFCLILFINLIRTLHWKPILTTIFWSILFSLWVIGAVWGSGYQNPLFLEKIVLGTAHIDTLFHGDILNMIKTYGQPSTGLDGLPYLNYHWGSHFIFAQISKILKLNGLDFYNLAYPVIFIPFLLKSLLTFVTVLQKKLGLTVTSWHKFWLVLFLGFAGIFSASFFTQIGLWKHDIFISESYLLAVSFLLILLALAINYRHGIKKSWQLADFVFLILFVPVFLGIIGMIKIPLAYLALGAYAFLFVRLKLYTQARYIISFLLSLTIGVLIYKFTAPENSSQIYFLHFVKNYVVSDLRNYFWLFYYFMVWIFIYLRLKETKIKSIDDLQKAFSNKKVMDVELLIIFSVLGFLPGAIMAIGGGSAAYFSQFQYWFAIGLILVYLPRFWPDNLKINHPFNLNKLSLHTIILAVIAVMILSSALTNIYTLLEQFVRENVSIRLSLLPADSALKQNRRDKIALAKGLVNEPQKALNSPDNDKFQTLQTVKLLYELGLKPSTDKKNTAIFVPQDNYLFWNILPYKKIQFVAPALSGLAMIDGIQPFVPAKDILGKNLSQTEKIALYDQIAPAYFPLLRGYGFSAYNLNISETQYLALTQNETAICRHAQSKGFQKVLILRSDKDKPFLSTLECKP